MTYEAGEVKVVFGIDLSKFKAGIENASKQLKDIGQKMTDTGSAMTKLFTVPIAGIGVGATKVAVDFESAFAGVRKTVDATEAEFASFKTQILDLSTKIPAAATEIAGVAEAAGQLGIQKEAIMDFTRTMIDLGVATNLSADEAATQLARLANITQMPQSNFQRLGSTVVALGNNLATTEAEIVSMSMRIAGAGSQIGLTEAQILSMAGALSSVGIEADAGGSAISRVMIDIASAVASGTDATEEWAAVAGMSAEDFIQAFQRDAAGTVIAFIEGLNRISEAGGNVFGILDDMGLSEIRVRDALLRASGAGDLFRQSLEIGAAAWEENIALTREAEQRYSTTASQMETFANSIRDVGISLGESLTPALLATMDALRPILDGMKSAAEWFGKLDPAMQTGIISVLAVIAGIGPALIIIGQIASGIAALGPVFALLSGPVGLTVAAIAGIITAGIIVVKNWDEIQEGLTNVWQAISDKASEIWTGIESFFKTTWDSIIGTFKSATDFLKNLPATLGAAIKDIYSDIIQWLIDIFRNVPLIGDTIADKLQASLDSMASIKAIGIEAEPAIDTTELVRRLGTASQTLRLGDTGSDVETLQSALEALGYMKSPGTGIFDATTKTALQRFQTDVGLVADAIAGNKTYAALQDALEEQKRQSEMLRASINALDNVAITGPIGFGDLRALEGKQSGGFTADVGDSTIAGIVHGGEWVAPAWMVDKFPGLVGMLEGMRVQGYQGGGYVSPGGIHPVSPEILDLYREYLSFGQDDQSKPYAEYLANLSRQVGNLGRMLWEDNVDVDQYHVQLDTLFSSIYSDAPDAIAEIARGWQKWTAIRPQEDPWEQLRSRWLSYYHLMAMLQEMRLELDVMPAVRRDFDLNEELYSQVGGVEWLRYMLDQYDELNAILQGQDFIEGAHNHLITWAAHWNKVAYVANRYGDIQPELDQQDLLRMRGIFEDQGLVNVRHMVDALPDLTKADTVQYAMIMSDLSEALENVAFDQETNVLRHALQLAAAAKLGLTPRAGDRILPGDRLTGEIGATAPDDIFEAIYRVPDWMTSVQPDVVLHEELHRLQTLLADGFFAPDMEAAVRNMLKSLAADERAAYELSVPEIEAWLGNDLIRYLLMLKVHEHQPVKSLLEALNEGIYESIVVASSWYDAMMQVEQYTPFRYKWVEKRLEGIEPFLTGSFAAGGMTGAVGTDTIAGIVHGGEWVMPAWMVDKFPGLAAMLEGMRKGYRSGGYAEGGGVSIGGYSVTMPGIGEIGDSARGLAEQFSAVTDPLHVFADVLEKINPYAEFLNQIMQELGPVIEVLLEPILMVADVLADALKPILISLFPVFKLVGMAISLVSAGFFALRAAAFKIAQGIVELAYQVFLWLPGFKGTEKALKDLSVSLGKTADESWNSAGDMMDAYNELKDMTYEEAEAKAKLRDAANETAGALSNIPQLLKVARIRADIAVPQFHTGAMVTQTGLAQVAKGERILTPAQQGGNIIIQGDVYGYDDFVRKVRQANAHGGRLALAGAAGLGV